MTYKTLKRKIKKLIIKQGLKLRRFQLNNSLIIFSEARGGSTWLMELIHNIPGTIVNWEPLHVEKGVVPKEMNLGWRPSLNKENAKREHVKLFQSILTYRTYTSWTTRYVFWKDVFTSKQVITKFVRANLCLPWIVETFPNLKHQPVLLMRHPIAVALSRLKTFDRMSIDEIMAPIMVEDLHKISNNFNEECYLEHAAFINKLTNRLELEVAIWCLNTESLLDHPHEKSWITIYYEDLVREPRKTFVNLLEHLDISISKVDVERIAFRKASKSNYHGDLKKDAQEQISNFFHILKDKELESLQNILDYFNVKVYNAYSGIPNKGKF